MPIQQTAKQAAITAAKQVAREGNEVLKSAREQIIPVPEIPKENQQKPPEKTQEAPARKDLSFLNVYKGELEQIRRDNLFKELQRRISEGEIVPLADFAKELSSEQREVLKAQMEALQIRKSASENMQKKESPLQVVAKKGRQMFNKIKKRNELHVETRMPPSS